MAESDYLWTESWIPERCTITSSPSTYQEIQTFLDGSPAGYRRQLERRLTYIGKLEQPISNKNYMYQIEAGYYECYIFGKSQDVRLVFDWTKSSSTQQILINIMGLTNHRGIKKRKFKEDWEDLTPEDEVFLEKFLGGE